MPHQLRRIIGINIRNPRTGMPSGRIAVLDPRGGVLAVGDNGAGKTTFLRLLPLFYGATAQQILRGTGRTKMIAYTLPDPSSAVAFEYERESHDDLRTVVMHCRPNEDAPQFHIISSGFREDYFYDESKQFVPREDFKARIEAMQLGDDGQTRVEVSPKLFLHQYRSVILNERLATKEAKDMRRLAARHSLGPKPLVNLDQIAAAMANEKIQFRDLQNIVIDRVSDSQVDSDSAANHRALKKNRTDVNRWLDDFAHLSKVMRAEPQAKAMLARVAVVRDHHLALCTLHVAVKEAYSQVEREQQELNKREQRVKEEFGLARDDLSAKLAALDTDIGVARREWESKRDEVASAEAQQKTFAAMGVEALADEQAAEDRLSEELAAQGRELQPLEKQAGSHEESRRSRIESVVNAHNARLEQIDQRVGEAREEIREREEELSSAREAALDAQEAPPRLAEIAQEKLDAAVKSGGLQALIQRPVETEATRGELENAREKLSALEHALKNASAAVVKAAAEHASAKSGADAAVARVQESENAVARNADALAELEQQLTPPSGSLLEFLRKADPEIWSEGAKLIDPALLTQTHLNPRLLPDYGDHPAQRQGEVTLGALALHTADLPLPSWVDMSDLRQQVQALTSMGNTLQKVVAEANALATKASRTRGDAEAEWNRLKGEESLASAARDNASATVSRLTTAAEQERAICLRRAEIEKKELANLVRRLDDEAAQIGRDLAKRKEAVRQDFKGQQARLASELRMTTERLAEERRDAVRLKEEEIKRINDDAERELAGLGIDPKRISSLRERIQALDERLRRIAASRHNVEAWRRFQRDVAPTVESTRAERDLRQVRCKELQKKRDGLQAALEDLIKNTEREIEVIGAQRRTRSQEFSELSSLLSGRLKNFIDRVPNKLSVDWTVPNLTPEVQKHLGKLESERDELRKELRHFRDLLVMRSGPVEHWVQLREQDLPAPQLALEPEMLCERASLLCDWFNITEYGPYIDAVNKEMHSYFSVASNFVRDLELFDRKILSFNSELQAALSETARFERFRELSVTVRSGVGKINDLATLRAMRDMAMSRGSTLRSFVMQERQLPSDEDVQLIRKFRDLLPEDGVFRVNLNDQVRLECSLVENGRKQTITSEEEFRAVSSNGNTALITAMFLMGFVQMIRGPDSPVRLTWITDEIGRFDASNLHAFLQTLDAHKIDVISASPSVDPALARYFPRLCIFEPSGAIVTSATQAAQEDQYAEA